MMWNFIICSSLNIELKEDDTGGTCSTHGGKSPDKRPFWRLWHRYIITLTFTLHLINMEKDVNWIGLAQLVGR
jgi:hypothetical protein